MEKNEWLWSLSDIKEKQKTKTLDGVVKKSHLTDLNDEPWIFFDYSGTLVDTVKALSNTYSRYLGRDFPHQQVKNLYKDFPASNKFRIMFKYKINPLKFVFGGRKTLEKYRQDEFWKNVKAFPGIPEVLMRLQKITKVKMAIVTHETELNDPKEREKILTHFGIPNVFATVITDYKNKEKSFNLFLEEKQITNGIFIGDTQFDIYLGKKRNFRTIGVTWGFSAIDELDADHIIGNPRELLSIITDWIHQLEQKKLHGDPI